MRRLICLLLVMVVVLAGCERRPFSHNTTAVNLKLKVKTEVNGEVVGGKPEMMRLDLFDINTGNVVYTDYISPDGGYIYQSLENMIFLYITLIQRVLLLKMRIILVLWRLIQMRLVLI